ncbi:uncharacterized protein LOC103710703 [Phoenix dactylifera]|uniref:Uncharacterized protein LOC103710703 n=1 Tax=Phoenix dactylifera TaxID=42345 RepID=A0A8B7C9T4_PHODC|nr:uncharacterized protein LOC103710703 [Phoenix dactylifera]
MGVDPWALAEVTVDSLPSLWTSHHESVEELSRKLLCATLELEALRNGVKEERRKSEENINQLIQILKITTQERDEAREQLQVLLNKIAQPLTAELVPRLSCLQPESPQMWQARGGNSSVTESESLSDTPNQHSYGCSPVESFFETVTSPELTSLNGADSCNIGPPQQPLFLENSRSSSVAISHGTAKYDRGDAIIDSIAAKKPLPEKGKLLETVLKIGPVLETLMVAGALPQWRNPPPLQPFQIPPVTVRARNARLPNRAGALNSDHLIQSSPDEKANGLSQVHAATMLNFSSTVSLCARNRPMALPCVSSHQGFEAKRQRIQ